MRTRIIHRCMQVSPESGAPSSVLSISPSTARKGFREAPLQSQFYGYHSVYNTFVAIVHVNS